MYTHLYKQANYHKQSTTETNKYIQHTGKTGQLFQINSILFDQITMSTVVNSIKTYRKMQVFANDTYITGLHSCLCAKRLNEQDSKGADRQWLQ